MKKKVIKAWAIVHFETRAIFHNDFRENLSIYATEEEAKNFAEPSEGEDVVEVEIHIPSQARKLT